MVTMAIGVNTVAKLVVGLMMIMLLVVISMILMMRGLMMVTLITQGETSEQRDKNQHSTGLHDGLE